MSLDNLRTRFRLREFNQFFESGSFVLPKDLGELTNRLSANVDYFQANYSILVALVLTYVVYHNFWVGFTLTLMGGIGFWLFQVRKDPIVVSGRRFTDQELLIGYAVGVATIMFYVGGKFLTYSLAFAGLIILVHAGLKKPSLKAKGTNAYNDVISPKSR